MMGNEPVFEPISEPVGGPRSSRGQRGVRRDRGARPSFARAPEARMLLPYREGKAASFFTVIGAPACTVERAWNRKCFFFLKILKEKLSDLGVCCQDGSLRRGYLGPKEEGAL